jgi:hypothetical protein
VSEVNYSIIQEEVFTRQKKKKIKGETKHVEMDGYYFFSDK